MPEPRIPFAFVDSAFSRIKSAIAEITGDTPELEGVAVVMLWRLDDQSSLPYILVQGGDGPLVNPDQLLRLRIAAIDLDKHLADKSREGVVAVRRLADQLAAEVRAHGASIQAGLHNPPETTQGNGISTNADAPDVAHETG